MSETVFTIGHSTHTLERFISLVNRHGITALCDVRSKPHSRINPQFNREALKQALQSNGVSYVFLGKELGGRSEDPFCYDQGRVHYARVAQTDLFQSGLARVREGLKGYRIVLMCAEKDPLECHRGILIARHIDVSRIAVEHILADGSLESHGQALTRLLRQLRLPTHDLLRSRDEVIDDAYRIQGDRIAYKTGAIDAGQIEPIWSTR